ncbi:MAG TPA: 16S rRNA (guanine(966)-N(2))-methyltransferase RsmD [Gaiellaceae bacterium]|nr:16S rRNA (guanine(966)-N(2))-methyltransferase RsmD [Gaiellaceae bacterium]
MRIVAGTHRGATIFAPKGLDTRPTSDRVREAVFNLVGPVDGASVLDLYAGSGAMGLEALSRGAESAVFVESDREACGTIRRNLEKLRLNGAEVVCRDALGYLATASRRFDLILVDPPYDVVESVAVRLAAYLPTVLAEHGLVALESSSRLEPELPPLELRTSRRYGSARVSLFEAAA